MASSGTNRRILSEVTKLQALASSSECKFLLDKSPVDDPSSNVILGRILPKSNIYNQAAFQIEIKLPAEYPFKAPELRFVTPIYHPNVDEKGKICVDLINTSETFKPTTPLTDVVKAVANLIDSPNIDHALNPEIAAEYTQNKSTFERKALDLMASKHIRLLKDLAHIDETFKSDRLFFIKKKLDASTCDAIHETDLTHPIFIYTPQQSPYLGGEFEIEISLPLDYPSTTPRVKFRTPIYSPVVDESGTLSCLPILQRWQTYPTNSVQLRDILVEIDYYITHLEDVDEPHRPGLLIEWNDDPAGFVKTAEQQTKELAKPQKR
ncbi:unnamed protein product [Adineta ricciae]|uniref:UBC core domain-containing protein n=1 Tax=Adineta ricciae TaxID=249248 RepID=A0A814E5M4_ADIRI|nr:unnamed protein product [Adineta ricciae]CAF1183394.1 unnamed protein product [Adineta ricciae]